MFASECMHPFVDTAQSIGLTLFVRMYRPSSTGADWKNRCVFLMCSSRQSGQLQKIRQRFIEGTWSSIALQLASFPRISIVYDSRDRTWAPNKPDPHVSLLTKTDAKVC